MRIYEDFVEMASETKRQLAEMGVKVHPDTYQDKDVSDNPDFETLEIQNHIYTVTQPDTNDLDPTQPWADKEFKERLHRPPLNPGEAWKLREEVWEKFLEDDGTFGYTYSNRLARENQIQKIIERIKEDPDSRQLFISIWDETDVNYLGGVSRVPCSLGYHVQIRKNQLNLTYLQRSCDFHTHFQNDVYLAFKMQEHIAEETSYEIGHFTHWIASLHVFQKDLGEVF